ncbi:hypothetical protein CPB84DRAFT_1760521 [Gymnopilus junonius]|uniref:Uncharacterized protein n=1 Tax=Gymnopilus junonius TaxID=109634 RepID=A0A9P5TUQ9_GYMJU|nr:hypothetical protein CPB84DRAFT_1760521 [Gymnopilus junonius]
MCHVSIDRVEVKFWFFPVHFRFTGGSWVTVTLDGFVVFVPTSKKCPPWIQRLRNDLIYTILNGDTIRLHSMNPNVYLSKKAAIIDGNNGLGQNASKGTHREICMRGTASQWHIFRSNTGRIYTFGDLVAEWRRCNDESRESFVLISREARWTKVPIFVPMDGADGKKSKFVQFLHTLYNLPSNVGRVYNNPICTLDLYVPQCDITFAEFRLRDAELLRQGATKIKEKYVDIETHYPGILGDMKWEFFLHAISSFGQG